MLPSMLKMSHSTLTANQVIYRSMSTVWATTSQCAKNYPENVNKRRSSISLNEKMFQSAAPIYQEAIDKSGYNYQLKFDSIASEPKTKTRSRKRHILWFNPPFNSTVSTNIGREFLNLIDKWFPTFYNIQHGANYIWKKRRSPQNKRKGSQKMQLPQK